MSEELPKVTTIKLNDGSLYAIFDKNALRRNENGVLITGNEVVDKLVLGENGRGCELYITEVDFVPVDEEVNNVLVQQGEYGKIMKRSIDVLLEDIGGTGMEMNDSTGTLSLKLGKF